MCLSFTKIKKIINNYLFYENLLGSLTSWITKSAGILKISNNFKYLKDVLKPMVQLKLKLKGLSFLYC